MKYSLLSFDQFECRRCTGNSWDLCNHDVVELFLLGKDERYLQPEIGPYGHYLVLQLKIG
jgi:hypothetical protein